MIGFIGKEFMYKAGLGLDGFGAFWVTAMAFAASVLMFAVGGIVALKPFRGDLRPTPTTPHEGPWAMLAGPLVLGALSLIFGLLPGVLARVLPKRRTPWVAIAATTVLAAAPALAARARAGDLVMTMGAGDVSMVGPEVLEALTARAAGRDERAGRDGEEQADR